MRLQALFFEVQNRFSHDMTYIMYYCCKKGFDQTASSGSLCSGLSLKVARKQKTKLRLHNFQKVSVQTVLC